MKFVGRLLCRFGWHDVRRMTNVAGTWRQKSCRREGCDWSRTTGIGP